MNKRRWIAFSLACGLMVSAAGNAVVYSFEDDLPADAFEDDYFEPDDPADAPGYLEGDDPGDTPTDPVTPEAPETDAPQTEAPQTDPPETNPPETEAPQTDLPQTDAPQTEPPVYVPETDAPVYVPETSAPVYTPQTQAWSESYQDPAWTEEYNDDDSGDSEDPEDEWRPSIGEFEPMTLEDAKAAFDLPEASELPEQVYLRVPDLLQTPELPTGCEATALTMVLQYEEFDVDKETVAWEYLIYNEEDDNMAVGYVGDPSAEDGAGCFAPALAASAEYYFQSKEVAYHAYDITDADAQDLYAFVASGSPVIVWTTMGMEEPEFTDAKGEYKDRTYPWYKQEHCVVLSGYDRSEGTVQVNDPMEGVMSRDMAAFEDIYEKTGKNAVVVKEMDVPETAEEVPQESEAQ